MQHIRIPELDITIDEQQSLLALFHDHQTEEFEFVKRADGYKPGLWLLAKYQRSPLIHRLESKLRHIESSYFLRNKGIEVHKDAVRLAVVSFMLENPQNIPTDLYEDDEVTKIDQIDYVAGEAVLWNPQAAHGVRATEQNRIFFHLDLDRRMVYDDYVELYRKGELFRW